jgi:hypothetical protein
MTCSSTRQVLDYTRSSDDTNTRRCWSPIPSEAFRPQVPSSPTSCFSMRGHMWFSMIYEGYMAGYLQVADRLLAATPTRVVQSCSSPTHNSFTDTL